MFKKLKEKITEEVKSSPQRFQQLTQSVSDRLQNSTTSDENFFSIGDDDANTSLEPGFTNVSLMSPQENRNRRNSSSSIASDVSFLPRYESLANMYHLQSDLEVSASEIEDNASTSSQLGHLTKEQIYAAFQKAQMRYHKYRGRYTDLAKHYKELERENGKMKSVLVETQDKAIRRVTELKEQSALEQKAKVHLESALRDEIDEKQLKIHSLETKIELLQSGGSSSSQENENMEIVRKDLADARQEIENLNQRLQESKANSIIFQSKEQEYKNKISALEKEISLFSEREKENNLTLAQNKMELHNELLGKDNEISNLKQDNENLKKSLEALNSSGNGKLENLQSQNKKLIEKLEALTKKCNGYENELLRVEQLKIELQNSSQTNTDLKNQLKEVEDNLNSVRENAKKSLLSLETKIREKLEIEFEEKQERMKADFQQKFEEVSSNANNLQEIQLSLIEKDEDIKKLREVNNKLLEDLAVKTARYDDLERSHLELIEESTSLRSKIGNLEKDLATTQNDNQACNLRIIHLQENVKSLEREAENYRQIEEELQTVKNENDQLIQKLETSENQTKNNQELATKTNELEILNNEKTELEIKEQELIRQLEEERQKCQGQFEINNKLNKELENLKNSIKKREVAIEEAKNHLEINLEEEKKKLQKSESYVKKLEESTVLLKEELKQLEVKNTEIGKLEEELQNSVRQKEQLEANLSSTSNELKKIKEYHEKINEELKKTETEKENLLKTIQNLEDKIEKLERENKELSSEIVKLDEEKNRIVGDLEKQKNEDIRSNELKVAELAEINNNLNKQFEEMKKSFEELEANLKIKEERIEGLERTANNLNEELIQNKNLLKQSNEELIKIKEESLSKEEAFRTEKKSIEDILEEVNLLKKLLEEANNSLTIKEHEMKKNEEIYSEKEKAFTTRIDDSERDLKHKSKQIEDLTKKLEEFDDLIGNKNEDFFNILRNVSGEALSNLKRNENNNKLLSLEEKLQHFEKSFSLEKENLAKILTSLKRFDEKYSQVLLEKEKLVKENSEMLTQINELQRNVQELNSTQSTIKQMEEELVRLKEENGRLSENEDKMKQCCLELESRNNQVTSDNYLLSDENSSMRTEIEELKFRVEESESKYLRSKNLTGELEKEISQLKELAELARHSNEKQQLKEEIKEFKAAPVNVQNNRNEEEDNEKENYLKEIETLRTKIVQYKSLDLTNRSSIEFYENELQKLKNQNEKLNRKLDETLVTLGHCSELSNSTEIEYLKNVLYNYMLGKESMVLARVIAAVCKFDPHQTELILAKEQQKQTLLGQLGIL